MRVFRVACFLNYSFFKIKSECIFFIFHHSQKDHLYENLKKKKDKKDK